MCLVNLLAQHELRRSQYGRIWGFGGGVSDLDPDPVFIKSALDVYHGRCMYEVVEWHQALVSCIGSNCFNWNCGSKFLFWQWNPETRALAQNRHHAYLGGHSYLQSNKNILLTPSENVRSYIDFLTWQREKIYYYLRIGGDLQVLVMLHGSKSINCQPKVNLNVGAGGESQYTYLI